MICKHCLMSIEPAKTMAGMWKASEGQNEGSFTCLDNSDMFVHEPDAPTPSGEAPDLHCVRCGQLLRPYMGDNPKRWCLAADPPGLGNAQGLDPAHYHQPINPPTKDNN